MSTDAMSKLRRAAFLVSVLLLATGGAHAASPEPGELLQQIRAARLEPERAVTVGEQRLELGYGSLFFDDGLLIPVSPTDGQTTRLVFVGTAHLEIAAPDEIEAQQLTLFTGSDRFVQAIDRAVLVIGQSKATNALLTGGQPASLTATTRQHAEALFARWLTSPERRKIHLEGTLLRHALGEPGLDAYIALWFRRGTHGDVLFQVEPEAREQVSLARFVPLDASEDVKRDIALMLTREQRRGRLLDVEVTDRGRWDTWLSTSQRGATGDPRPGTTALSAEHYDIDLTVTPGSLDIEARAEIRLRAHTEGSRFARLRLYPDLRVTAASGEEGANGEGEVPLFFLQQGEEVLVQLPRPIHRDATTVVALHYAGKLLHKPRFGNPTLRDPTDWYPQTGDHELATYDVTFHWPEDLELVAAGARGAEGNDGAGRRWRHYQLAVPASGFSFEIGDFDLLETEVGHVKVRLAFGPTAFWLVQRRDEILTTVRDAMAFFEATYGPYPLDEITVAIVRRQYSQAMLGFVTLSAAMMSDRKWTDTQRRQRRAVIAHEVSHQWWGHLVGWASYRDRWISEAMANFSAMLFARSRSPDRLVFSEPLDYGALDPTAVLPDDRPVETLGPLVLGERLFSSLSNHAFQTIVYRKGAVVLNMLARLVGEAQMVAALRDLVDANLHRTLSTESFLAQIERSTGTELAAFARQFIYGAGLTDVFYRYSVHPQTDGTWQVHSVVHQRTRTRNVARLIVRPDGSLDVVRDRVPLFDVEESALMTPVQIGFYDPQLAAPQRMAAKNDEPRPSNATVENLAWVQGAFTELRFEVEHEPRAFWLDRHREVLGRFFHQRRHLKRFLYYQALDRAASGDPQDAEGLLHKALDTQPALDPLTGEPMVDANTPEENLSLDLSIHLALARLYLDEGRSGEAAAALREAQQTVRDARHPWQGEGPLLEARLALHRGRTGRAYRQLRKTLWERGGEPTTEGLLLLALAARATGHDETFHRALAAARRHGADVALLTTHARDAG